MRGWKEPWRSRFSRTRRETLSFVHETSGKEQGCDVEFQRVSLLETSEAALNAIRASMSELEEAPRSKRGRRKSRKQRVVGFAIVSLQLERERQDIEIERGVSE